MKEVMQVSYSRIREWTSCQWRYTFKYDERLQRKREPQEGGAMVEGGLFHQGLEHIYLSGYKETDKKPVPNEMWDSCRTGLIAMNPACDSTLIDTVMQYISLHFSHAQQINIKADPVMVEFPFAVRLDPLVLRNRFPTFPTDIRVEIVGVMDLITRSHYRKGEWEIWDHKLQANQPAANSLDKLPIIYPQMGMYAWASEYLGKSVRRMVMNVMGKRAKNWPLARYPIEIRESSVSQWENWIINSVGEMFTKKIRMKSLGSQHCNWCEFSEVCNTDQERGDRFTEQLLSGFAKQEVDSKRPREFFYQWPDSVLKE